MKNEIRTSGKAPPDRDVENALTAGVFGLAALLACYLIVRLVAVLNTRRWLGAAGVVVAVAIIELLGFAAVGERFAVLLVPLVPWLALGHFETSGAWEHSTKSGDRDHRYKENPFNHTYPEPVRLMAKAARRAVLTVGFATAAVLLLRNRPWE